MGWFKADPVSARAGSDGVTVSLLRAPSARKMTLRMRLGREAMRHTGWTADLRVELLWGDDGHAGCVMVRPAGEGAGPRLRFPHKRAANFLETTFGHVPHGPIAGAAGAEWTLPVEVRPSAEAGWRVEENALVVTLPQEWWQVATPASVAGRREAAEADPAEPVKHGVDSGPETQAPADPGPPRSDPNDPKLQDMARHLLSKGCTLPELRARLQLDADGFRALCATLRERGARKAAPEPAAHAETPRDVKGEIARIRGLAAPNGSARP